jgi:hypothetical protein
MESWFRFQVYEIGLSISGFGKMVLELRSLHSSTFLWLARKGRAEIPFAAEIGSAVTDHA